MRHKHGYRKLGVNTGHRKALLRSLAKAVILNERITTTDARAKEMVRFVSRLVTLAKGGTLSARRQALSILPYKKAVNKLFSEIGPRFADISGGYLRCFKLGYRKGDGAPVSIVEFSKKS
ncbi:MAG: 50S ribosomal protein L17 [Deltaproteobacteria bacterium]|nr:50S ribosomal protein L17 [Deltaproteobacteria bacterium]